MITIAGISLVGVVITAVVGPMLVERRKATRFTPAQLDPAAIGRQAGDAVALIQSEIGLIQSEITDLQNRVGRLETLQMAGANGQR